jgi:hypothetical protein
MQSREVVALLLATPSPKRAAQLELMLAGSLGEVILVDAVNTCLNEDNKYKLRAIRAATLAISATALSNEAEEYIKNGLAPKALEIVLGSNSATVLAVAALDLALALGVKEGIIKAAEWFEQARPIYARAMRLLLKEKTEWWNTNMLYEQEKWTFGPIDVIKAKRNSRGDVPECCKYYGEDCAELVRGSRSSRLLRVALAVGRLGVNNALALNYVSNVKESLSALLLDHQSLGNDELDALRGSILGSILLHGIYPSLFEMNRSALLSRIAALPESSRNEICRVFPSLTIRHALQGHIIHTLSSVSSPRGLG